MIKLARRLISGFGSFRDASLSGKARTAFEWQIGKLMRIACVFTAMLIFGLGVACGQVPQILGYQGRVTVSGVNFQGNGQFRFALVNGSGTQTYWSNDGSSSAGSIPVAAVSLPVAGGLYSVLLGNSALPNMNVLPPSVFQNSAVFLRIWFDDGAHGPQLLVPDQQIAAVGYAMMAGNVPDGAITSSKIAPGAVGTSQLASNLVVNGAFSGSGTGLTGLTASQIAFTPSGTGATPTNLDALNRSRPINAMTDFGAKGDSNTDDTASLQAALDAGKAQGKPVYIPAGKYKLTKALTEYWIGMTIFGDGQQSTILMQYAADQPALSVPQNPNDEMCLRDFQVDYVGSGASTASGIYLNGDTDQNGVPGQGNSADDLLMQNVTVNGFRTSLECFAVANSHFQNCSFTNANAQCVYVHGNSNSLTFTACPVVVSIPGSVGYEMDSGRGITVEGSDLVVGLPSGSPTAGSAVLLNGAENVTFRGCNVEAYNSSSTIILQQKSRYLTLDNVNFGVKNNCSGYSVQLTTGGALFVRGSLLATGPGASQAPIRVDRFVTQVFCDAVQVHVDQFQGNSVQATYCATPFWSATQADGLSASSSTNGTIRVEPGQGFGDDWLAFFSQINGGTYVKDNLNQYNSDVRAGIVAKTNSANTWSANQTLGNNLDLILNSSHGSAGTGANGGLYFQGSNTRNWLEATDLFASNDWALELSPASGAIASQPPNLPIIYVDGANNLTTIGHNAASRPSGTAALNVEGTGTIYVAPQGSPQGNNEIWSNGIHLFWRNNSGSDRQLDN